MNKIRVLGNLLIFVGIGMLLLTAVSPTLTGNVIGSQERGGTSLLSVLVIIAGVGMHLLGTRTREAQTF